MSKDNEDDFGVEINSEVYDKDFDEAGWEPEVIDYEIDKDNKYGY